ncbi:translation initiation factor eIF4e [Phlegmacium glaucopus]|nr:translation initiation factor eIF4e [Phlegmacium glaucopus]
MSSTNTDASITTAPSTTIKKMSSARPPSLNQLAARLNSNAAAANGGTAAPLQPPVVAPRPRLAAFALRTGSNASNDSLAVNAPSTRAASPSGASTTSSTSLLSKSTTPVNDSGGEPLTTEKLEELNQETAADAAVKNPEALSKIPELPKRKVGYKNIPSLDAITARWAKARRSSLSVDGSAMPPEPQMIEDPKTPGLVMKAPEHPLQFSWTIYHDSKGKFPFTPASGAALAGFSQPPSGTTTTTTTTTTNTQPEPPYSASHPPESTEYEAGLTIIGEFSTVEEFCRYFNWLKPPSMLEKNSNYHIFKSGIKPMWEDEANANGGKWVLTMKNNPALLDRCWNWLAMALVGEELEDGDEICGAVVSLRTKVDRIQLWTRSKDDVEKLNGIGKKLVKLLDISEADQIGLEFQHNSDDRPPPNKFISIQSIPTSSFRPGFPSGPSTTTSTLSGLPPRSGSGDAPAGANIGSSDGGFGNFGTGMGIGGQVWKAAGPKKA